MSEDNGTSAENVRAADVASVWVGCLGCYNAGSLVGYWVPANEAEAVTVDTLTDHMRRTGMGRAAIAEHAGRFPHEELWCFDHENMRGMVEGECSPSEAQRVGDLIDAIEADNFEPEAVAYWHRNYSSGTLEWDRPTREAFESAFCGKWDTFAAYVDDLIRESGMLEAMPENLRMYFNAEAYARDLESDFDAEPAPDGGVYVFNTAA